MELPKQVVSLELAKKLKELGVKQESYFKWVNGEVWDATMLSDYETPSTTKERYAAFTVAELGEMLWMAFEETEWSLIYKVYGEVFGFKDTQRIGELGIVNLMRKPDMAAKMLIYLIENKLI